MAILLLGEAKQLRTVMGASPEDFALYRNGTKEPPWEQFDRLIEIIMVRQREEIERTRARLRDIRSQTKKKSP